MPRDFANEGRPGSRGGQSVVRSICDLLFNYSLPVLVDPTGLKPAPHGLKGRRSVTRAPGHGTGCGGRIRTFACRINNPVPYQLGYATRDGCGSRSRTCRFWLMRPQLVIGPPLLVPDVSGCGDESRTRIISFTRRALWSQLSYAARLVDREGFKPSQEVCRTSMLSVTSPARRSLVAVGGVEPPTFRL
jgi:hypothetical protein